MSEQDAIRQLNTWGGQPLPLSASRWHQGRLTVRLSGARAAVEAAVQKMGGQLLQDADAFWDSLREQRHAFFADTSQGLWRLSVPTVAASLQLPGEQLIEWGGAQRWVWSDDAAEKVRDLARSLGGHAVCFDIRQAQRIGLLEVFDRPSAALMAVHQRLKQTFDPQGVFNPGRLYRDM